MNLSLPEEIQNFGQKGMENDLKKGRLGHMENGSLETGEIVVYQPDEITRLEVKVEDDTVWLTQAQMAELFGRERTVITKHIRKIFEERELEEKSNVHFLHFANSDKPVKMFSLDVIISVGYRVKSVQGTRPRQETLRLLQTVPPASDAAVECSRTGSEEFLLADGGYEFLEVEWLEVGHVLEAAGAKGLEGRGEH